MRNNKGFSLVELIVVIAIMAILAAVAIPTFAGFIGKANVASDISFMNDLEYAVELAHAKEPEATIASIEVTINNKGEIQSISYKMSNDDAATTVDKDDAATDDVAAVADWKYNFKAADKAKTDDEWKATWTVTEK